MAAGKLFILQWMTTDRPMRILASVTIISLVKLCWNNLPTFDFIIKSYEFFTYSVCKSIVGCKYVLLVYSLFLFHLFYVVTIVLFIVMIRTHFVAQASLKLAIPLPQSPSVNIIFIVHHYVAHKNFTFWFSSNKISNVWYI